MTNDEPKDFAVDFYWRMREAVTGRISRDAKRRADSEKRSGSKPFDKGRDPIKANDSLDALLKQFSWDNQLKEAELFTKWAEIVGELNAQNTQPESLNKNTLVVRCRTTAWAAQMRLMSGPILDKISGLYPDLKIDTLKFLGPDAPSWKKGPLSVPGRGPRDTYG
ncbi:MAG: DUF721 domain-containing protein [Micrococcales bacterium]